MIAIVNISDNPQPAGVHTYALKINQRVILQFQHNRQDDLATCLRKAADAYDDKHRIPVKRCNTCTHLDFPCIYSNAGANLRQRMPPDDLSGCQYWKVSE